MENEEKIVLTKYSKAQFPPPNECSCKLTLTSEQSEYFWDCIERLNGVLSVFEVFGFACSDIQKYVELDNYLDFSRHLENSLSFVTSNMDAIISDLLAFIDY